MSRKHNSLTILLLLVVFIVCSVAEASVVVELAKVEKLAGGFRFTEGPAADAEGNIYFSDIPNTRIHK